jgi:ribosome-binding factor A
MVGATALGRCPVRLVATPRRPGAAMSEGARSERVGAELLRELTMILRADVRDPRVGEITLQEVRVSRDLSHAKVYFTCFPLDAGGDEQAKVLNGSLAGFLRRALSRRVRLRTVPQLHFVHDLSVLEGERLAALIERSAPPKPTSDPDDDPPT